MGHIAEPSGQPRTAGLIIPGSSGSEFLRTHQLLSPSNCRTNGASPLQAVLRSLIPSRLRRLVIYTLKAAYSHQRLPCPHICIWRLSSDLSELKALSPIKRIPGPKSLEGEGRGEAPGPCKAFLPTTSGLEPLRGS